MQIDLVQLRTFVAVAEEQHLTRAAERLYISLSAASAHVRAVEQQLDATLFLRTNRSLELTRAGQLLLTKAKILLNEAALFSSFAREIRGKVEGHLVVGCSSEPASSRIGELVHALRSKHPLISLDLCARPSYGTRQGLKAGEIDVGLVIGQPIDEGFTYYHMTDIAFRVAGPAAWKDRIENASWAELAKLPWLTPTDSRMAYSIMLREFFQDRGLELNNVVKFDNAALARAMLDAGVGVMLMRETQALQGVEQGRLAVSPIAHTTSPIFLAHIKGRGNDPLIGAFVEAAAEAWPGLQSTPALADS